ncbi:YncE family protein [Tunturiibacter lichenicola]|uniref:YncE family protein n=1 Tax=Tunturiibacter lichenicola TaxID=2051959 RepID=UPI003D9AD8F0
MKRILAVLMFYSLSASFALTQMAAPLVLERKILLPGVKGKFDHFAIDEVGNRLFAAATGNKSVEVIDLASEKVTQSLTGMGKPHGLVWVAATRRLFVADGEKAELTVFEGEPLKLLKSIKLFEDADDMVYDAQSEMLYVGHGGTDSANPASVAILDAKRLSVLKQLSMAAHPEALELDPGGKRVFVNVSDAGEVVVIDGRTHLQMKTWTLANAKGNTPLAYDGPDDLLLVGCRMPAKLLVLNGKTGEQLSSAPADSGADDLFYDAETHRAYLITGSGAVDSFSLSSSGKLQALGVTHTAVGAKTGLLVPSQSAMYIGVPGTGTPSEVDVYRTEAQ